MVPQETNEEYQIKEVIEYERRYQYTIKVK